MSHAPPPSSRPPNPPVTLEGIREVLRLYTFLRPYRGKFVVAMFCLLLSGLLGLAFPYFTGRLIDVAQRDSEGVPASDWPLAGGSLNGIALTLVAVVAVQSLCSFLRTYWLAEVGQRSLADLREATYGRLIRLPMAFFAQRRVGELASRITSDLSQIQHALTGTIPTFLSQVAMLLGGVPLLLLTSGRLTLVMLSSVPPVMLLTAFVSRLLRKNSREGQDKLADTNVIVEETLQGIAVVKAYANEGFEATRYRSGMGAFIDVVIRGARLSGAFGAFSSFAMFASMVLTIWYGARLVQAGELTFGEITQFLLYTMYVAGAFGSFGWLYSQLQQTLGATERVRELLRETQEIDVGGGPIARLRGNVAFENVVFSYPSRKEVVVLRDLSLEARSGQRVALVGPSGAGKSTIVSLLLRFYDPDAGRVRIDGRDAREYPLKHLRDQMAIVPQDVLLFGGTIAENVAYGKPGASLAEIEDAARKANAHDFIQSFPEGYQTIVGERGVKLSGGQRQRVAIARAILKDPAILILDEATSSLDSESETLVQQALETLMQGRTSIIIAHRLATVRKADCIYVIKDGQVVEAGTHAELLARPEGVYRTLSELQFDLGNGVPVG